MSCPCNLALRFLTNKWLPSVRVWMCFIFWQRASVVKHLRDFHSEVQAFCSLEAQVAQRTVALEAARNTQTPTEVAVVHHPQERLAVVEGRAQPPGAPVKPPQRGQDAVQWVAEEAGHEDCSTKVSHRREGLVRKDAERKQICGNNKLK